MKAKSYFVCGSAVLAAVMWLWVQTILIPYERSEAMRLGIPRGNLSDLYPRWLGSRELLLRGKDPYRADVTREIQAGYYGRPLDANRPNDPKDQQGFAYPVYVAFLLAPTVNLSFPVVREMFLVLLIVLSAGSVIWWARALGWRMALPDSLLWILLTVGCFPAIQGFKLQQLTLLVAALMAMAGWALAEDQLIPAGFFLALASIKPQLVALPMAVLCLWTLGDWKKRQRFLWSLAGTMLALIAGGEFLQPGWISRFRAASAEYWQYTGGGRSVLDVELGATWGRVVAVFLVCVLFYFAWQLRHARVASAGFGWLLALTMSTTLIVIPMFAPYNQVLLVPVLMVIVRKIGAIWSAGRWSRFLVAMTALSLFWPWIAAAGSLPALFFGPASVVQKAWALPLLTNFATPTLTLGLVLTGGKILWAEMPERA